MNMRTFLLAAILLATFLNNQTSIAQEDIPQNMQEEVSRVDEDSVALQPFSVIGITREIGNSNRMIIESGKKCLTEERKVTITKAVDSLSLQIQGFLTNSSEDALDEESSRELDEKRRRADFYLSQIESLEDRLSSFAGELESEIGLLQSNRQRWQHTLEQGTDDQTLESRQEHMDRVVQRLDSVRILLQDDLVFLLEMQDQLSDKKLELDELVSRVKEQKAVLGETIFNKDVPGFFKDLGNLRHSNLIGSHTEQFKESIRTDFKLLKSAYMRGVSISLLAFLVILGFWIWFKKYHRRLIAEEYRELSELHQAFINSPVASSLFFVALMIRLLIPDLPQTFNAVTLLIMLVPMAILMVRIYGGIFRIWVIVLVLATSINILYELAYHPGILIRIVLLGLGLIGIWIFTWICRKKPFASLIKHRLVYRLFRVLVLVFLVMQFLSIIANLAGRLQLAEFFALIPIQITLLAVAIQVATKLGSAIIFLELASNYMQKFNVVREEFQVIYRKSIWLLDFILLCIFLSIALGVLRIKDLVFDWGRGVLSDGFHIGAVNITLGSILIFIFVIWLSIMISRIISHILEKDVFTRVKTAKGVPSTVILLLKIVLISGGFFLAAAASGMPLTNLSIVLGAFSVGIGFGLQNIFNNMVSGLILAFERPIKVGDVVQVGELLGTVRSIGLRSSTVKSFDGAEVIVPNGNLISNEMINWTLSDSNRRMDIRVGVAYGTDPEVVLEIMGQIAAEHTGIRKKPSPRAYFIEFGDSSLNFRLLAWVHLDSRLEVESELNVLINKKLAEAGIEIPFPQTDLHIRSDATRPTSPPGKANK